MKLIVIQFLAFIDAFKVNHSGFLQGIAIACK